MKATCTAPRIVASTARILIEPRSGPLLFVVLYLALYQQWHQYRYNGDQAHRGDATVPSLRLQPAVETEGH